MSDLTDLARRGWHRLTRTAAYVLMPKFTTGAVVVARDDSGRRPQVLLVRKRSGGHEWGFPAGYVGYGATILSTAARELAQETGLRPIITTADHLRTYRQPWAMHLDHLFVVAASGAPQVQDTLEIAQAAWHDVDALPSLTREALLALEQLPDALTRPLPSGRPGSAGAPPVSPGDASAPQVLTP